MEQYMNRLSSAILAIIILGTYAVAKQSGKEITIYGEVIETQCYVTGLTGPGKGSEHKDCAVKCARNGIPLSILEDKTGNVYLAGQSKKAMSGATELLLPYIAAKVKVTGRLFEKGGMRLLLISNVEKIETSKSKKP